jgi:hypothetical protein
MRLQNFAKKSKLLKRKHEVTILNQMVQRILDTNTGKQLSEVATDV